MARPSSGDRLDQAVTALLAGREVPLPAGDRTLDGLVRLAAALRGLPRASFKARLGAELRAQARRQGGTMTTTTEVAPVRKQLQTVIPYLLVRGPDRLVDFVKKAFGATELLRTTGSAGGRHAEVRIGDSTLMIGGFDKEFEEMPTALHFYVEDADAVYNRALEAGATSLEEPADRFYGERSGGVKDPFGNHWYIATHKGPTAVPEGLKSVTAYLHPRGAAGLVDFLKRGLGAEEGEVHRSPDGTIQHAKIRIGESVVEMGEAHGPWQPMPTMFYVYVSAVDAGYHRALQAGATSVQAPADQSYGDRTAAVKDPFGNVWYIAAPTGNAPA